MAVLPLPLEMFLISLTPARDVGIAGSVGVNHIKIGSMNSGCCYAPACSYFTLVLVDILSFVRPCAWQKWDKSIYLMDEWVRLTLKM